MQYKEIFKVIKNENFPLKNFDIFLIFAQNIDCGYTLEPPHRGGSKESMFWRKNKKNRYTPAYPSFYAPTPNFEEVEGAYWFGVVRPVQSSPVVSVMRE